MLLLAALVTASHVGARPPPTSRGHAESVPDKEAT